MPMNKIKLLVIIIAVLFFGQTIGLLYFAAKSRQLSKELASVKPGYQSLSQSEAELKGKQDALTKENTAMRQDRENLLTQIKTLLAERNRANELVSSLDKANASIETLDKEKKELDTYALSLKEKIDKLEESQDALAKERDKLKGLYESAVKGDELKELNKKAGSLQKENASFEAKLTNKEKEYDRLVQQKIKIESENNSLNSQLKDYKTKYAEALKKNRSLEQGLKNMPGKFTEMARQNQKLLKETAQMHYNLGVFYTKNKLYDRAIVELEKVIEVDPDDAYAHFNLGYIYAQYLINRHKAIEHFRHFLRLAKSNDKDIDWVKKYLLTWEAYDGKSPVQ